MSSMKYTSLVILTMQNMMLAILMRYSRTSTPPNERYITSTAVVVGEVLKLVISIVFCFVLECNNNIETFLSVLKRETNENSKDALKLLIPSGLYVLQNNLLYIASSNLPAAVLQVLQQMKIITTAILSEIVLKRTHSTAQRMSVFALAAGVALVQQSTVNGPIKIADGQDIFTGVLCVSIGCITSGFAGVSFEYLLKGSSIPLWVKNIEMAIIGIFIAVPSCYIYDYEAISLHGFFHGYSPLVWGVILLSAGGGLVVAVVVKYADNVLKGFATSISIVLSVLFSALYLQETNLSMQFMVGTGIVVTSAYIYGTMSAPQPKQVITPSPKAINI